MQDFYFTEYFYTVVLLQELGLLRFEGSDNKILWLLETFV